MPSPAITQKDLTLWSPSRRRLVDTRNGSVLVPWQTQPQNQSAQGVKVLFKPATVVNARRPDGTRAMSAYATRFMGVIPHKPCSFKQSVPGTAYAWEYENYPSTDIPGGIDALNAFNSYLAVIPPLDRLAADAEARTRVLGKLSQKKWDLGVTALEIKQTAGLVTEGAMSFVRAIDSIIRAHRNSKEAIHRFFRQVVRHGDFYKAAAEVGMTNTRLLESIRSMWMQYQFGVKPLVHDIMDSSTFLAEHMTHVDTSVLLRVKAGAERRGAARRTTRGGAEPYPRFTLTGDTEVRVHFSAVYEMPIGTTGPINQLGLDNAGSLFWEVTRLSWMYDYFIGIGSWLESLTASRNMVFREGCRSELRRFVTSSLHVSDWTSNKTLANRPFLSQGGMFERDLIAPPGIMPAIMPVPRSDLGLVQLGNAIFALSSVAQGKPGLR